MIIRIWNIETGLQEKAIEMNNYAVTSIAITKDEKKIITGGFDNTVRIWNIE